MKPSSPRGEGSRVPLACAAAGCLLVILGATGAAVFWMTSARPPRSEPSPVPVAAVTPPPAATGGSISARVDLPPAPDATEAETAPETAPAAEQAPVRVGGRIREPRKIHNVAPVYPEIAKQARVQGIVILECTIDTRGRVADVRVLRGIPLLDAAATDAVRQWRYEPTVLEGVPVPVLMTVTVNFSLR